MEKFYILEEHVYADGGSIAIRGGEGGGIFNDLDKAMAALTDSGSCLERILYEGHFEDGELIADRAIQAVTIGNHCDYVDDQRLLDIVNEYMAKYGRTPS